jgi:transposase
MLNECDAWANIPLRSTRRASNRFGPWLYKARNLIERFFNTLIYFRRIAVRCDKLGATFRAMAKRAAIRLELRAYEPTAWSLTYKGHST